MALWGLCGMRLFLSNIVLYLIYIFNIVVMYPYVCEGSCAKVIYRHSVNITSCFHLSIPSGKDSVPKYHVRICLRTNSIVNYVTETKLLHLLYELGPFPKVIWSQFGTFHSSLFPQQMQFNLFSHSILYAFFSQLLCNLSTTNLVPFPNQYSTFLIKMR